MQIAGRRIAHQPRLDAPRQGHGLGRADRLSRLALRPVVAIGGQGDHHPMRIETGQPVGQQPRQPVRAGDRSGIGGGPAFVIGHQHRRVGGAGHRLQRLVRPRRHRGPDLDPRGAQRRPCGREQPRISDLGARREVLQVEDVAGVALGPGKLLQLADQGLARGGVEDHRVGGGLVPDVVVGVGDQRHELQPRSRPRCERGGAVVGFGHHLAQGTADGEPARGEHVQAPHLARQGRQVAAVPGVVEADEGGSGGRHGPWGERKRRTPQHQGRHQAAAF